MVLLNILTKDKYNELLYRVDQIAADELTLNYSEQDTFIFEDKSLIKTQLDIDIDDIKKKLIPTKKGDSKSAIIIYEAFKNLTPISASNKYLWTTLCHREFNSYTKQRWPITKNNEKLDKSLITSHYFFMKGGDRRAYRRNSISRLWWASYLTINPWDNNDKLSFLKSEDEYKYTKIMLSSQQLWFDVLERRWGCDQIYRICYLEAYDKLITSKMHERCSLSETNFSNRLARLFTATLLQDVGLVLRKEPKEIIEYVFELSRFLLKK
tara:strand:- start:278 stop:1078 length:801 start_codon:yes stop_codon:yes gene_type:complete